MNDFMTQQNIEKVVSQYALPLLFVGTTGFADTIQTYHNVQQHGVAYEGNVWWMHPLMEITTVETGLLFPKLVAGAFALGTTMYVAAMNKKEGNNFLHSFVDKKGLLYLAGAWWGLGFLSNWYYH